MNAILERLGKGREEIQERIEDQIGALQERQRQLKERGERAVSEGRDRFRALEAGALEQALELLVRANDKLDAAVLKRGEEALEELLVSVRAGQASTLPIEGFDELSIKKIKPHFEAMSVVDLKSIRAYEASNKNRVTLLRAIDAHLEEIGAA